MKPLVNPADPRSAKTQIATTVGTYRKAVPLLKGRVLDYGAGLGLGADALRAAGLKVQTFEPFPERWKSATPPSYRRADDIPSDTFDSAICLNVLNVVDRKERDRILRELFRALAPGGVLVLNARSVPDVAKASVKRKGPEEGSWIIGLGSETRYQKGFTQKELEDYVRSMGWTDVRRAGELAGVAVTMRKPGTGPKPRPNPAGDDPEASFRNRVAVLKASAVRMRQTFPLTPAGDLDVKRMTGKQLADAFAHDQRVRELSDELKAWAVPASGVSYSQPAPSVSMVRRGAEWAQELMRELNLSPAPKRPLLPNPMTPALRRKLSAVLERDDRILDYDRAKEEDLYRLYDVVYTDQPLNRESLTEIEGLLDDRGVLVILSGEMPPGLGDHFKRAVRHQGMVLVQHPKNPEEARINAEKARRGE